MTGYIMTQKSTLATASYLNIELHVPFSLSAENVILARWCVGGNQETLSVSVCQ